MKKSTVISFLQTHLMFLLLFTFLITTVGFSTSCSSGKTNAEKTKKKKRNRKRRRKRKRKKKRKAITKDSHNKDEESSGNDIENSKSKDSHKGEVSSAIANEIWKDLIKGNRRFASGKHTNGRFVSSRKKLLKGQHPEAIVIGCADSRVPPELIFDKNLGDLFVIRTAGNIADPIALGSIEYAAEHLHSKVFIVLGHESCGAVGAALSKEKMPTRNLKAIVNPIRRSFKSDEDCKRGSKNNIKCVKLNVARSAQDIISKSPIMRRLVKDKKITVIEAVYKMESGKVERIN